MEFDVASNVYALRTDDPDLMTAADNAVCAYNEMVELRFSEVEAAFDYLKKINGAVTLPGTFQRMKLDCMKFSLVDEYFKANNDERESRKAEVEESNPFGNLYEVGEWSLMEGSACKTFCKALDYYSRIGCGQFEEMIRPTIGLSPHLKSRMIDLSKTLQRTLFGTERSQGIGPQNYDSLYVRAYQMYKEIRHRLAWDECPQGGNTVDFQPPQLLASDLPRITIVTYSHKLKVQ